MKLTFKNQRVGLGPAVYRKKLDGGGAAPIVVGPRVTQDSNTRITQDSNRRITQG